MNAGIFSKFYIPNAFYALVFRTFFFKYYTIFINIVFILYFTFQMYFMCLYSVHLFQILHNIYTYCIHYTFYISNSIFIHILFIISLNVFECNMSNIVSIFTLKMLEKYSIPCAIPESTRLLSRVRSDQKYGIFHPYLDLNFPILTFLFCESSNGLRLPCARWIIFNNTTSFAKTKFRKLIATLLYMIYV